MAAIAAVLSAGSAPAARATVLYTLTNLSTLAGPNSFADAMNASGQVTGYDSAGNGFLYSNGNITALGTTSEDISRRQTINASGQITGVNHARQAFLCTLGGPESVGQAINDGGEVTGYALTGGSGDTFRAFIYSDGTMTDLNTLIAPALA